MGKILWLDTETSGVDAFRNDIIQIGYIVEIDGELMEQSEILMAPTPNSPVSVEALKVNKFTTKEISEFQSQQEGLFKFETALQRHINRFDSRDKLVLAGYNVGFDDKFLRAMFKKLGNNYYGSYILWAKLDVQSFVAKYIIETDTILENYKLATVCAHFNIDLDAHDALEDIKATRKLYQTLQQEITYERE